MSAYYNERDPFAAQWLRNLIAAGHIAPGEVDERSIKDVSADDLRGFTQCHFFAGIGVWSHVLRRAGWDDSRPVWTGSCPCQPFSAAGKQGGFDDERHLWPVWFRLIAERRPPVVLGEQVASALDWLDLVSADLENTGYAFGASDLCAAGFQGAHIRQRLYFVGVADALRCGARHQPGESLGAQAAPDGQDGRISGQRLRVGFEGPSRGLAHADDARLEGRSRVPERPDQRAARAGGLALGLADADLSGKHGRAPSGEQPIRHIGDGGNQGIAARDPGEIDPRWAHVDWLLCRNPSGEPSWRPVEPGTFPLAHGVAGRMGKLRAYGNALDAETATEFVAGVMEALPMAEMLS